MAQTKIDNSQDDLYGGGQTVVGSRDLERAVLGACLSFDGVFETLAGSLRQTTFYEPAHQPVYLAMASLLRRGAKIDLYTVTEELKRQGTLKQAGEVYGVMDLTNAITSPANVEYHVLLLTQYEILREGGRIGSSLVAASRNPQADPVQLLEQVQKEFYGLMEFIGGKRERGIEQIVTDEVKRTEAVIASSGDIVGLATGFRPLDQLTSGLHAGELTIIAARPSMGKTALAVTIARNIAKNLQVPVGIFSLEMTAGQLVLRVASMESGVPSHKIRNPKRMGPLERASYFQAMEGIADLPLRIDDTSGISLFELRSKARRMKVKHGIGLLLVDYVQLVSNPEYKNREQEISSISRGLKGLAKDLDIPVVALSQLSRAVEVRGGMKRPQLSDLRESGSLEQDADNVWAIYRPEYYGIEKDADGNSTAGRVEVIVLKHRQGGLDTIDLFFDGHHTEFSDTDFATGGGSIITAPDIGTLEGFPGDLPF